MDDVKQAVRETEAKVKETWRKIDGEEDLGDKVGNLGDDVRKDLGNAGDRVETELDRRTPSVHTTDDRA